MIDTHTFRGYWWLPEDEKRKLSGTLTVTKGDARLELLDNFGRPVISKGESEIAFSPGLAERPRILGVSTDGKAITLEGHRGARAEEHFPGIPTSTYPRVFALIGGHFAPDEEIAFDEIAITASDLNAWTEVSGFDAKTGMRQHEKGYWVFEKVSINYEAPDDVEIPLARGERAFIRFSAPSEGIGPGTDRVSIRQQAALHLRFAKRASLADVVERVGQLRNFLSLAVGRPVAILSVTGFQDDFVREPPGVPIPITILWQIVHNPDPPTEPRHPRQMLFTLREARPDISRVMRAWFAKQERLEPVFNLFFGMLYHPDMYLDVRFLMFAQAVETFGHRRGRKVAERYFADQVKEVLDTSRSVSKRIVGPHQDAWVKWLKVTRDFRTHYNPTKEKAAAKEAGLLLLTLQLRAIIEMSLLRELGFPAQAINEILDRVGRYREIEHFRAVVKDEAED